MTDTMASPSMRVCLSCLCVIFVTAVGLIRHHGAVGDVFGSGKPPKQALRIR